MPRNGSGVYSLPASTAAVSLDPISSAKFNTLTADVAADLNTARPVVAGGTGATSASAARTNLGIAIGTDVQAYNDTLALVAGVTPENNTGLYFDSTSSIAKFNLALRARTFLEATTKANQRTDLGLGSASVADLIDEDDFASDSDTKLPSQQSVKAYIISQIEAYRPAVGILDGTGTPSWTRRKGFAAGITDNGTGHYTVSFQTAEANANYIVQLTIAGTDSGDERIFARHANKTANGFDIILVNVNNAAVDFDAVEIAVFR